jgi:hypothetical protein
MPVNSRFCPDLSPSEKTLCWQNKHLRVVIYEENEILRLCFDT